jgi:redox-sensing transcriptional repressor
MTTPEKTVERLSIYRRLVEDLLKKGQKKAFSHEIADFAGVTSSQVRRDFMFIGTNGKANTGYDLEELLRSVESFLTSQEPDRVGIVGVGNLGRAILSYFSGRRPNIELKAAFDSDPNKIGRVIHGCRVYSVDEMPDVIKNENINVGVIAVPMNDAQNIAEKLVKAGVSGILNFAPFPLSLPGGIYVENVDLTMTLEKVAHFARKNPLVMEIQSGQ